MTTTSAIDLLTLQTGDSIEVFCNGRRTRLAITGSNGGYGHSPVLAAERIVTLYAKGGRGAQFSVELWKNGCISLYSARGLRRDDWVEVTTFRAAEAN